MTLGYDIGRHLLEEPTFSLFTARYSGADPYVLLKVATADATLDRSYRRRFLEEARVARQADDLRVLAPRRLFETDGRLHAEYPWPGGDPLPEVSPQIEPFETLAIAIDIGHALVAIHRQNVVHGDLRPTGVLVGRHGRTAGARLLDPGLCVAFGDAWDAPPPPGATAPELPAGSPLDARTDIYQLGALCYYMLTGRVWTPDASLPANIPPSYACVLKQCLEPRRFRRPHTMMDVVEQLARVAREAHATFTSAGPDDTPQTGTSSSALDGIGIASIIGLVFATASW